MEKIFFSANAHLDRPLVPRFLTLELNVRDLNLPLSPPSPPSTKKKIISVVTSGKKMQSTGSLQTPISLQLKVLSISGIMAVSIPQLDNFISLVGSISCTALAIIFPIFIHILTLTSEGDGRVSVTIFFKDAAIMLMGVLMFMFGTYTSVARIIERYENGQNK